MISRKVRRITVGIVSSILFVVILLSGIITWRGHTPDGQIDFRFSAIMLMHTYNPFAVKGDFSEVRRQEEADGVLAKGKVHPVAEVKDFSILSQNGNIPARIYHPKPGTVLPVIVFYHGGGWVFGSLNSHDVICRNMALEVPAVVVAVGYRLAPEHPFPAATDDTWAALLWVKQHASDIGADPNRIAVMGDSSGGNLSAVVAQRARGVVPLSCQILLYPVTDLSRTNAESYQKFDKGFFLSKDIMTKFIELYTPRREDRLLPLVSPLREKNLAGLTPAYVISATFDVLRDDGEEYAKKMRDAGVDVRLDRAPGMIHGFMVMGGIVPHADEYITKCAHYAAEKFGARK